MTRLIIVSACAALFALVQSASAQPAMQKAEQRLAELLAPRGGAGRGTLPAQPLEWKAAPAVQDIAVPVKPYVGAIARLPRQPVKDVKPRSAPEGLPLVSSREESKPPQQVELPTTALIRLPSVDVDAALPIPILAQPYKDRASLGDPAFEASVAAALKPIAPTRDRPVPFVPLNLPDPFEYIRSGQLRNSPDENPVPPVIPLRRPI